MPRVPPHLSSLKSLASTAAEHLKSAPSSGLFIDQILQDPSIAGVHPVYDAQSIFKVDDKFKIKL